MENERPAAERAGRRSVTQEKVKGLTRLYTKKQRSLAELSEQPSGSEIPETSRMVAVPVSIGSHEHC